MTEDQLERETLAWLQDVGYTHVAGPDIAPDGPAPERSDYRQVLLAGRLRAALVRLNPAVPMVAIDDALAQVQDLGVPALLAANRRFHRLLVAGVPVQYLRGNETVGDFVRLVDWTAPERNEWLAVNQFSVRGPRHTRRPDVVLFVNGLPLVLLELKNPADQAASVWKAYDQIQTYKEQIPDLFHTNEVLVISDGTEALLGSLSASAERFMAWRTIDGVALDPLGQFNELQTLVRGVLAPQYLLDYLRYFVLFEDDEQLVKKIAGYHQFHAVRAAIAQVVAAATPGSGADPAIKGKGGVVWHTQGSGKSITMREEVAFMQGVKVLLTKRDITAKQRTDEQRELAVRQIISQAVVSESVVDIFDAVGLEKPNIGLLDEGFLAQVRALPERNLAVELLERLLEGEIKSRFASNVVQSKKFSDLLGGVIARYQNRSIETAQVMEELLDMARKFREAHGLADKLGLSEDEVRFYTALADNESAVRELSDDTLKKIAHELTDNLRKNLTVDWTERESVQAKLRLMVKRILRKYKYPPDLEAAAVELVLQQAQALGESWAGG